MNDIDLNRPMYKNLKDKSLRNLADTDKPSDMTPVYRLKAKGGIWVKRDDAFMVAGVRGGKVRTCLELARQAQAVGARGLITAGARQSPQVNIVAQVARNLGLGCRVHVPQGALTPELEAALEAGAELVRHKAGYNNVIIARARADAEEHNEWYYIPFGMECMEAVVQTAHQVHGLPFGRFKRIVVPVGSGMTLAGILTGLNRYEWNRGRMPGRPDVVGVVIGADPVKRMNKFAPVGWDEMVTFVPTMYDYHDEVRFEESPLGSVPLDPIYEAKCVSYLKMDDLFWVVGVRQTFE
jgi:1-aminocyclopropane-1-carboxylate deaminase/D-cysteine desulfhydrase-like pyridoxal-dependent ACC family enzyme